MNGDPLNEPAEFGYAVWLMPAAPETPRLLQGAERWARRARGIVPEQHLTLRARLSLEEARALVGAIQLGPPLRLTLGPPERGERPWRALHRPVLDGRDDVEALYGRVCDALGVTPTRGYLPHVSMAYASLERATDDHAPAPAAEELREVVFDRLEVWDLRGTPGAWRRVR